MRTFFSCPGGVCRSSLLLLTVTSSIDPRFNELQQILGVKKKRESQLVSFQRFVTQKANSHQLSVSLIKRKALEKQQTSFPSFNYSSKFSPNKNCSLYISFYFQKVKHNITLVNNVVHGDDLFLNIWNGISSSGPCKYRGTEQHRRFSFPQNSISLSPCISVKL